MFRPNKFGRSFGRKFGGLYDDYVKNVSVSACAINKTEEHSLPYKQEVRGSSPRAPTIRKSAAVWTAHRRTVDGRAGYVCQNAA
jgi:hypothetical protein